MLYLLQGTAQHYAWGGDDFIANLVQQPLAKPTAEWWLGAHNSSPSVLSKDQFQQEKTITLNCYLKSNTSKIGKKSNQFTDNLPYLLKILDVKLPLSIQLHPTIDQAIAGYEREELLNIPLNSPQRIYKDKNHKPEMMLALSEFYLLHGFKSKADILQKLKQYPSFEELVNKLQVTAIVDFYSFVMKANKKQLKKWLLPVINSYQEDYKQAKLTLLDPNYWLLNAIETMGIDHNNLDHGLLSFYLFNIVKLETGQAIYQAAGIPHAYLRGQNLELMANSDNVIRGGLTTKHVDVDELLNIINCNPVNPQLITPKVIDQQIVYPTPAVDFELHKIELEKNQEQSFIAENATILLLMEGQISVVNQQNLDNKFKINRGGSIFIDAGDQYKVKAERAGYFVTANIP